MIERMTRETQVLAKSSCESRRGVEPLVGPASHTKNGVGYQTGITRRHDAGLHGGFHSQDELAQVAALLAVHVGEVGRLEAGSLPEEDREQRGVPGDQDGLMTDERGQALLRILDLSQAVDLSSRRRWPARIPVGSRSLLRST